MFLVLVDALLYVARTKRGRRLLLFGGLGVVRLVRSAQARRAYAEAWRLASHPAPRRAAGKAARNAARRVKR
ncbi:MAG TPA: hypothetical protein VLV28_01555 [Gaiellaceae bacterium]|nr:hypothetical protein [Gaiellaceae bacterium]